jgi:hypothetical protein
MSAGAWIARTPLALFAIAAGLALDSVARLFMTFSSSYFRLIGLPSASYGLIGSVIGGVGLAVSPLARRMVGRAGAAANFTVLALVTLAALAGIALRWPIWGVVFVMPLGMSMAAVAYLASFYLNAAVDSQRRATVLSFKGVAFNLGYGFVSLAFAGALRALRAGSPEVTFGRTLPWLPVWLAVALVLLVFGFWSRRAALRFSAAR